MAAQGDPVAETITHQIVDFLPLPLPPKKNMKERAECEMLETMLLAHQVQFLKRTGDSGSNPEQTWFR